MSSSVSALFQPLLVGAIKVGHRIVMAPLTHFCANKDHVYGELAKIYYTQVTQRASVPGTLIVSETTSISPQAGGHANAPAMRISPDGKPFVQLHVLQCFGTND